VGAFAYSHGIEAAVEAQKIHDQASLLSWIDSVLEFGTGRADAILFCAAWRATQAKDLAALYGVAERAAALRSTAELGQETTAQGRAFSQTIAAAWPQDATTALLEDWDGPVAYPVAVATASAGHGIGLNDSLCAYLHAFSANLVSAGVRLIPLGQTDGQRTVAALEEPILALAAVAPDLSLSDAGSATWMVDWCSMQHETQRTRLFRS
jgi:urease accessory protein